MNRREYIKELSEHEPEHVVNIANEIFDYYESRICENCKYWNEFGRCTNSQVVVYLNGEQPFTFALFGCNKFECKENI